MLATNTSSDQELLARCVHRSQDARDLPIAFESVARLLADHGAIYAFAGRCGHARFCRAQWTDVVQVRIAADAKSAQLKEELESTFAASLSETSSLRLELGFVASPTELRLLEFAASVRWFNADARMATAEHLLWLALPTKALQANVDAVNIIQSGHVDWSIFDALSIAKGEQCRRLHIAREVAERTTSSNYSESVERRLAR